VIKAFEWKKQHSTDAVNFPYRRLRFKNHVNKSDSLLKHSLITSGFYLNKSLDGPVNGKIIISSSTKTLNRGEGDVWSGVKGWGKRCRSAFQKLFKRISLNIWNVIRPLSWCCLSAVSVIPLPLKFLPLILLSSLDFLLLSTLVKYSVIVSLCISPS